MRNLEIYKYSSIPFVIVFTLLTLITFKISPELNTQSQLYTLSALFQGLAAIFGLGITAIFIGIQLLNEKYSYKSIDYLPRFIWGLRFYIVAYSIAIIFPLFLLIFFEDSFVHTLWYKIALSIEISLVAFLITYTALKINSLIKSLNPGNFFEMMMSEIKSKKNLTKKDLDEIFDTLLEIIQKAIRNNDELLAIEGIRKTVEIYEYYLHTIKIKDKYTSSSYLEGGLSTQLSKYLQTSKKVENQDVILEIVRASLRFFDEFTFIREKFGGAYFYIYNEISQLVIQDAINYSVDKYFERNSPLIFIILSDISKIIEELGDKIYENPLFEIDSWDFSVDLINYLIKPISTALNELVNKMSSENNENMEYIVINILLTLQKIGKTIVKIENISFYLNYLNDSVFELTKKICKWEDFEFLSDTHTNSLNEYLKEMKKNVRFPTYIEEIFLYFSEIVTSSLRYERWYSAYMLVMNILQALPEFKNVRCKRCALDAVVRMFDAIQKVYSKSDNVYIDFICFLNEALQEAPELKAFLNESATNLLSTDIKNILFENLEECFEAQRDKHEH